MSSARLVELIAISAVSKRVDLPTPGSPPTRTSDAGTRPPPSTRSSSSTPVGIRRASSTSTSTRRNGGRAAAASAAPSRSSASVPKAPQPGQRPSQRPLLVPHSVHAYWIAAAFATRRGYAAPPTAIAKASPQSRRRPRQTASFPDAEAPQPARGRRALQRADGRRPRGAGPASGARRRGRRGRRGLAGRRARGAALGARPHRAPAVRPGVRPRPPARGVARRGDAPPGERDRAGAADGTPVALAGAHKRAAAGGRDRAARAVE